MNMPGFTAGASFYKRDQFYPSVWNQESHAVGYQSGQVVMTVASRHPCDRACECCGLWNAPACCNYCWRCWLEGP